MALIIAVLAVAVAVTIAVALNYDAYIGVRRTQNTLAADQARVYARAAESMAMQLLERDREANDIDTREDIWAQSIPPLTLDDGAVIELAIDDLQGRFNLNSVAMQAEAGQGFATEQLRRLLTSASAEYDRGIPVALADWLDADTQVRFPDGAEDDLYTRKERPYRPGNTLMRDSTELRLVQGMDNATWRGLRAFVTALPEPGTGINVNTASASVLESLSPDADERTAQTAAAELEQRPAASVEGFLTRFPAFAAPGLPSGWLAVSSRYFLARVVVRMDRARRQLFSVIHRPPRGGMKVVYRAATRP